MATTLQKRKKRQSKSAHPGEPAWDVAFLYPPQGEWTEDDYLELERNSGNRMIELADGCLEVLPTPDMYHQDIVQFLLFLLRAFVKANHLGRVYIAPMPVSLFPGTIREPDIVFLESHRIKDKHQLPKGADLAMEVVSPDAKSRQRDLKKKRRDYAKARISEYWIIDPKTKTITVLTLSGQTYQVHGEFKLGMEATSRLLKGFEVSVTQVFEAGEEMP